MALYSLFISKDYGWEVMNELGKCSVLDFLDLNKYQPLRTRKHETTIRQCNDSIKKLAFIEEELKRFSIKTKKPASFDSFLEVLSSLQNSEMKAESTFTEAFATEVDKSEAFIREQSKNLQELQDRLVRAVEYKHVLIKTREILNKNIGVSRLAEEEALLGRSDMKFANITGVIDSADSERFKRLIFRMSRGTFIV